MLKVYAGDEMLAEVETLLFVPFDAPEYPDKFRGETLQSPANAKHAYHALSQIALYDFEDGILEVRTVPADAPLSVKGDQTRGQVEKGLVITRSAEGKVMAFVHEGQDAKGLLKFAHRYCTRWIRLDI